MNNKRGFRGIQIPKELSPDRQLNLMKKCILMETGSVDNQEHCWLSNRYLAKLMGCSKWKVMTTVKKLKKCWK